MNMFIRIKGVIILLGTSSDALLLEVWPDACKVICGRLERIVEAF